MSEQNLKNLIEQVDMESTNKNARVRFIQYGGGTDEMMIEATKNGFVRLGLFMLKAAYANDKEEQKKIASGIAGMITTDSDCYFDWFERKDSIEEKHFLPSSNFSDYFAIFIFIIIIGVIVLGFANGIRVIANFLI